VDWFDIFPFEEVLTKLILRFVTKSKQSKYLKRLKMINARLDVCQWQIVPYKKFCLKDEVNSFNKIQINNLIKFEFFACPLQQRQLKSDIKFLVCEHSLPFKQFRSIFPQLLEIFDPRDKVELVFRLFREFAENPSEEICGRAYWVYYKGNYKKKFKGKECFYSITRCGVTYAVLFSSIFGIEGKNKQLLKFNIQNEENLKDAWSKIEENANLLKTQPENFIVYSFLMKENPNLKFPGHEFMVIQHLNQRGKLQFHIFQSFIGEYCLINYLQENKNILSSQGFRIFFEGLQNCILSERWTQALESFYVTYFNVKKGFNIGCINPCKNKFGIGWNVGNVLDVLKQTKIFESFRKAPEFPKIQALDCALCLRAKIRQQYSPQELIAAKKQRLAKMDIKLREIYEKSEPTGQEPIQVDLHLLDLDLCEEGLINVPERDENGNLVLDEDDDVKWVDQIVTLGAAARDVIAELNKIIQSDPDQTTEPGKRTIYLNTNKEPFRTYAMLGIPLDKFCINENETKELWLYRIIDALVKKGYISKFVGVNGHGYCVQA
jgi:hypothetical protein